MIRVQSYFMAIVAKRRKMAGFRVDLNAAVPGNSVNPTACSSSSANVNVGAKYPLPYVAYPGNVIDCGEHGVGFRCIARIPIVKSRC